MSDNQIVKRKVGRPSVYGNEIVTKLEEILKKGGTVEDACSYALISKETYYRWLEEKPEFMTKMESAKIYPDIAAKKFIVEKIVDEKSDLNARWWLEKRRPSEFGSPGNNVAVQVNFGNLAREQKDGYGIE